VRVRLALPGLVALLAAGCGGTVVGPTENGRVVTPPKGNPAAGKVVFLRNACGGCHTFTPAGTTAKVGPDLDQLPDYAKKANVPLEDYTRAAIVSPPAPYVPPGFPTNAMPTTYGTSLSAQQVSDLVAFLTER
jgi:mono/diheme cytochrome c family protein